MTRLLLTFCLLLAVAGAAFAGSAPLPLILPDPGTYSYWVQSKDGTVSALPVTVSEKQTVKVTADVIPGDHLVILDSHTGDIATQVIALGLDGKPLPVRIKLSDFHPLTASASAPAAAPTAAPAASDADAGDGTVRLLTGLVSFALALGVLLLLIHLVRTRGEPLLHLARRAGVEVPDPALADPEDVASTVIYTPARRTPASVPEETGMVLSGSNSQLQRGPQVALNGVAALIGLQGLVAGSTFALTEGDDVIMGRTGECSIVLAENTVSRRHARLFQDDSGQFILTDLGSANGVWVNGMRIQRAVLKPGDEIKVGDNYFRFQTGKEE